VHSLTAACSACVACNSTILTEHTSSASSQASSLVSLILPKVKHESPQKLTYTHGLNYIHYIAEAPSEYPANHSSAGGLTFLCVSQESLGRRIPFGFLLEVKKRFLTEFDPDNVTFSSLPSYGCAAFNSTLKGLMYTQGATTEGQNDAIRTAQYEIDDVRDIMNENIERVLERGDRIDLLVNKTDRLGGSARDFRLRSTSLRRRMWWKNVKLMALLIVVVIFLLYLFIGFGCGLPAWGRCVGHN